MAAEKCAAGPVGHVSNVPVAFPEEETFEDGHVENVPHRREASQATGTHQGLAKFQLQDPAIMCG
jgi:hypothetical protein